MTKHTPGTWYVDPDSPQTVRSDALGPGYFSAILTASDRYPHPVHGGGISAQEAQANAAFIVRAVNAHDDLVSTLESVARDGICMRGFHEAFRLQISAALAKARKPD